MRTKGIMATEKRPVTGTLWLTIPTSHAVAEMLRNVYLPRTTIDDNAAHLRDCWNAIEAIGGEAETVGELVGCCQRALQVCRIVSDPDVQDTINELDERLTTLLAKLPEPKQ